jgi:hypothetical protein
MSTEVDARRAGRHDAEALETLQREHAAFEHERAEREAYMRDLDELDHDEAEVAELSRARDRATALEFASRWSGMEGDLDAAVRRRSDMLSRLQLTDEPAVAAFRARLERMTGILGRVRAARARN